MSGINSVRSICICALCVLFLNSSYAPSSFAFVSAFSVTNLVRLDVRSAHHPSNSVPTPASITAISQTPLAATTAGDHDDKDDVPKKGLFSRIMRKHHDNDNERQTRTHTSKRMRIRKAARKALFAAVLSTSMWVRGNNNGIGQLTPPAAHAKFKDAVADVDADAGTSSVSGVVAKVVPVIAVVGGVVIAKKLLSDEEEDSSSSPGTNQDTPLNGAGATAGAGDSILTTEQTEEEKEALRQLMILNKKNVMAQDENLKKIVREREARDNARMEQQQQQQQAKVEQTQIEPIKTAVQAANEEEDAEARLAEMRKVEEEKRQKRVEEAEAKAALEAEAALEAKKKAQQILEAEAARVKEEEEARKRHAEEQAMLKAKAEEEEARKQHAEKEAMLKAKAEEEARLALLARQEEEARLTSEMEAEAREKVVEDEEHEARLAAEANATRIKAAEEKEKLAQEAQEAKLELEEIAKAEMMDPSEKYAQIEDLGERAYQILIDLGIVEVHPDPDDPSYDSSRDNEYVE